MTESDSSPKPPSISGSRDENSRPVMPPRVPKKSAQPPDHDSPPAGSAAPQQSADSSPSDQDVQPPPIQMPGRSPVSPPPADPANPVDRFLERARYILTKHGGLNATTQVTLMRLATEYGLSQTEAQTAIDSLQQSPPPVISSPGPPQQDSPPSVTGSPPAKRLPQEIFRDFVIEVFGQSTSKVLKPAKEDRLVEEGKAKLRLSAVLARQIVHDVAEQSGRRILSLEDMAKSQESPDDLLEDSTVDRFLERAAAILAEHRGINAKSHIMLAAAGEELGLNQSQIDATIAMFQAAAEPVSADDREQQRIAAFRDYLRQQFTHAPPAQDSTKPLPSGSPAPRQAPAMVILSKTEARLIEDAEQLHGVDAATARKCIREISRETGVPLVTDEQAASHVASLVEQLLGDDIDLNERVRSRIFSEGSQWGLSPIQIDKIIRERVRGNRRKAASERRFTTAALSGVIAILLLMSGMAVWLFFLDKKDDDSAVANVTDEEISPKRSPYAAIENPTGEEWWAKDPELLIAITKVRVVLPGMKGVLIGLNHGDANLRGRSYREMIRLAVANLDDKTKASILRELVAGCYLSDPEDACAEQLQAALFELVPAIGDELPEEEDALEPPYWAVETAAKMFSDPRISPQRATALSAALARTIDLHVQPGIEAEPLRTMSLAAVSRYLLRYVTAAAADQPLIAGQSFAAVSRHAIHHLDEADWERAAADFLVVVLPAAGESWTAYEELIQRTIRSRDPLIVLKLVEIFEEISEPSLQGYLAERLLARAGVVPERITVESVAAAVREALGATGVVTDRRRGQQFDKIKQQVIAGADLPAKEPLRTLQATVDYAFVATLACALSHGEIGRAIFDELHDQGKPKLAILDVVASRSPSSAARREPSSTMMRNVLRFTQNLSDPSRQSVERISALRGLAAFAKDVPELPPESSANLAEYLLQPKPSSEAEQVLEHVTDVTRWLNVRLALADRVEETRAAKEPTVALIAKVTGRAIAITDEAPSWRSALRRMLLADVRDQLARLATADEDGPVVYDDCHDVLLELYVQQARLAGVTADRYTTATSVGGLLKELILAGKDSLRVSRLPANLRDRFGQIETQLGLADFLGESDLQRTVMLQRLWIDLLAMRTSAEIPGRADAAKGVLETLAAEDEQADDVFDQIRQGELAIMKLWLLIAGKE